MAIETKDLVTATLSSTALLLSVVTFALNYRQKADYWNNGSWTNKIQIADLDVPARLKLNQERGLEFALPAGPNEVVMRP